jgi:glycosyltransferase involved in cell wall biosynthesis
LARSIFRLLPSTTKQRLSPTLRQAYFKLMGKRIPQAALISTIDNNLPWGVGVFGYLTAESGVAEGARGSVEALQAAGIPISPINVTVNSYVNSEEAYPTSMSSNNPFRVNLLHLNADQMASAPELIGRGTFSSRYTIGYWAWELAEFPDALVPAFDAVHEVWVPSQFVADALSRKTSKPVLVFPHRVERNFGPGMPLRQLGIPPETVKFLTAVDFNSYIERKNIYGAITAFRSAFAQDDTRAHLIIKVHGGANAFTTQRRELREIVGGDPRISLIDQVMQRADFGALQRAIDVFVSLHRAEGFGLPIAECMAQGKLVIATDYSGSTDFVSNDCAMPVPYQLVPVGRHAYPFGDGQFWAEPDLDAAAQSMQTAVAHPELRLALGRSAAKVIATKFSAKSVGLKMASRLDEIRTQLEGS